MHQSTIDYKRPHSLEKCAIQTVTGQNKSANKSLIPMILDTVAAAEEHHDLLVEVLLQESEQQQQALVSRYNNIALLQPLTSSRSPRIIYTHIQRLVFERQTS